MKPILIIKAGCTFPSIAKRFGDFEDWILAGLGLPRTRFVVKAVFRGEALPAPGSLSGVVITGSHSMVSEWEPWNEPLARWLPAAVAAEIPLLGICYGHQLLARVTGGEVWPNPLGRQMGTAEIRLTAGAKKDPLLGGLPKTFLGIVAHRECVRQPPPAAVVLATAAHDLHHAFRIGRCAWGVQFHPEFSEDIVRAYIEERRALLEGEGRDAAKMLASVRPAPQAGTLLQRFAGIVKDDEGGKA
jgi:GMP synthase (glutamine-hydrolysing)